MQDALVNHRSNPQEGLVYYYLCSSNIITRKSGISPCTTGALHRPRMPEPVQ